MTCCMNFSNKALRKHFFGEISKEISLEIAERVPKAEWVFGEMNKNAIKYRSNPNKNPDEIS